MWDWPILLPLQWIMIIFGALLLSDKNTIVGYNCIQTIPRIQSHKILDDSWPRWSWFKLCAYMWARWIIDEPMIQMESKHKKKIQLMIKFKTKI